MVLGRSVCKSMKQFETSIIWPATVDKLFPSELCALAFGSWGRGDGGAAVNTNKQTCKFS